MTKSLKNGLQVIQDPDPQSVSDYIEEKLSELGYCERTFTERCDFRLNEMMKSTTGEIRKCRGGITFGDYIRGLIMDDVAKFLMRKEARKDGHRPKQ